VSEHDVAYERAAVPAPPARHAARSDGTPVAAEGHELLTVLARRAAGHGDVAPVVRRQPELGRPPLRLRGGDLTLTPGAPRSLLGSRLIMPGSLRVSSLLGVRGSPGFIVDIGPQGLLGGLLGSIDLRSSTRPGTPPDDVSEESQSRIQLVNPVLRLDPNRPRLSGAAVLSIGSDYPPAFKGPTEIDVTISSTELGEFSGTLGYGPLRGNFQLSLRYDTARLARALGDLGALGSELAHPGFRLTGGLNLGPLPLSRVSAEAPTTRPLDRPLLGAPAPFPLTASAGGVILAPPGALFTTAVPALGYTRTSFGERSGTSFTAAALPTLSPAAISGGEGLLRSFPVYLYSEITYVRRVGSGLDLGIAATLQIDSPTLAGLLGGGSQRPYEPTDQPPTPNIGARVFGRFSGL
jgi:hypothetical protein